jgi:nucleotide-binding universal stress UspA family protein
LRWAIREAELRSCTLEVVHAFVIHPYSAMFGRTDRELAQARLDDVVERNHAALERVTWSATLVDADGSATAALLEAAADAELVVVGARGAGGFKTLSLGSTSYRTAAPTETPVAVVPGDAEERDGARDIIVGIDGSPSATRALRWALDEAGRRAASVTVVHGYLLPIDISTVGVVNEELLDRSRAKSRDAAIAVVDRVLDQVDAPDGVTVRTIIELGAPAGVLLAHADDQLMVVGTRGHGTFRRVAFGSISQQVLHHAAGPVVVVP